MTQIEIYDPRMKALLRADSELEKLATGATWSEGPVYLPQEDCVIWSDIPGNRLLRWSEGDGLSVFLEPVHFQNGHTLDLQGRILACSHGKRCVERLEQDGTWTMLVNSYKGKKLNSPNDIIVKSDGAIWFTDPSYGLTQSDEGYGGEQEQDGCYVYRFDPATNEIGAVVTDMVKPNGLAFSPDEKILYISDTAASHDPKGHHHIRAYDVLDNKRTANGRVFAVIEPGLPDGFRVDQHSYIFTSSLDSIQVYSPKGERLGKILVPEKVGNCAFGGPDKNRLFIAASTSLYAITLETKGLQ
jgi:gluconolactonase